MESLGPQHSLGLGLGWNLLGMVCGACCLWLHCWNGTCGGWGPQENASLWVHLALGVR